MDNWIAIWFTFAIVIMYPKYWIDKAHVAKIRLGDQFNILAITVRFDVAPAK